MKPEEIILSPAQESILNEYFEHHAGEHAEICRENATLANRMWAVLKNNPGAEDHDVLIEFIDREHDCMSNYGKVIIYMPALEDGDDSRPRGKIIVESIFRERIFVEIQLARKTDFGRVREQTLREDWRIRDRRIYNIRLAVDQAVPFVRNYLFLARYTQRFLITSASGVLGSMTTQKLRSRSGQLLAFRECLLKE